MKIIKDYIDIFTGKADIEDIDILYDVIYILPIMMIGLALYYNSPFEILVGLKDIILANDVFLTDYIQVTSVGASLVNSALVTILVSLLLKKFDLKPQARIFSAIFITTGFSYIGKNLYNIWPFYIGGYMYCKAKGMSFRNVVVTSVFAASLAPIVSITTFFFDNRYIGIFWGYLIGIVIGYIMSPISNNLLTSHSGYTLYSTGFAAGFVGAGFNSIMKSFGHTICGRDIHSDVNYQALTVLFIVYFLVLIYLGYIYNGKSFKGYTKLISYSGRLVTDFPRLVGIPITFINMGVMGLIGLIYIVLMGGILCGSTIAGLLTIVGFSSFGKHPKNAIPLMIGVAIGAQIIPIDVNQATVITIGLFSTALAPIAGEYGVIVGNIIGMAHLFVTLNTSSWHSGVNLYNNGFSSGIIAILAIPILNSLNIPKRHKETKENN